MTTAAAGRQSAVRAPATGHTNLVIFVLQAALDMLCPLGITVEARDYDWIKANNMQVLSFIYYSIVMSVLYYLKHITTCYTVMISSLYFITYCHCIQYNTHLLPEYFKII